MKKAFTLIELLVVIAIIALLLSIVMPALKKAKELMKDVSCRANVKQLMLGMALYADDHNGRIMEMEYGERYWFRQIAPYLGDTSFKENPDANQEGIMMVGVCPVTKIVWEDTGYGMWNETWGFEWNMPGEIPGILYGSYAVNSWVLEDVYNWFPNDIRFFDFMHYDTLRGDIPVIIDSFWVDAWPMSADVMPPSLEQLRDPYTNGLPHQEGRFMWRFCVDRHGLAVNVGSKDCSVAKVKIPELWTLHWNTQFKGTYDMQLPTQ